MARKRYSDEDKQTIQPRFHYLVEFVFGVASDFDVAQSYGAVNRPDKGLVPRSSIMGAAHGATRSPMNRPSSLAVR